MRHTIQNVALVVARLANVGGSVVAGNARTNTAIYPLFLVVFAREAGSPASVHAAAAAAAVSAAEATPATWQTAAHGRVEAGVAVSPPGGREAEGFEALLVLGVDGAAVLERRHLFSRQVEVALGLCAFGVL